MRSLLRLFLALTLEVKAGKLTRSDLRLRTGLDNGRDTKFEPLRAAQAKYKTEKIKDGVYQSVLPSELAESLICDGSIDDNLCEILTQRSEFREQTSEEEWETVWWALERNEQEVVEAAEAMEAKFAAREYTKPGILLHVFANRLDLPGQGLSTKSIEEIEQECTDYIENLKNCGALPGYDPSVGTFEADGYGYSDTGHLGMGYPNNPENPRTPGFRRLFAQLRSAQMEVFTAGFADIAGELLGLMLSDPDLFRSRLCVTNSSENLYTHLPVLAALPPRDFVQSLVELPAANKRIAFDTLRRRYEQPGDKLEDEKEWLVNLEQELTSRMQELDGICRWQLEVGLNDCIRPHIRAWAEVSDDDEAEDS